MDSRLRPIGPERVLRSFLVKVAELRDNSLLRQVGQGLTQRRSLALVSERRETNF